MKDDNIWNDQNKGFNMIILLSNLWYEYNELCLVQIHIHVEYMKGTKYYSLYLYYNLNWISVSNILNIFLFIWTCLTS